MLGHQFELFSMAINAALAGLEVALVSHILAEEQLRSGALCELTWCQTTPSPESSQVPCSYFASWKADAGDSVRKFTNWLSGVE